jgi:hypothetical protein
LNRQEKNEQERKTKFQSGKFQGEESHEIPFSVFFAFMQICVGFRDSKLQYFPSKPSKPLVTKLWFYGMQHIQQVLSVGFILMKFHSNCKFFPGNVIKCQKLSYSTLVSAFNYNKYQPQKSKKMLHIHTKLILGGNFSSSTKR